MKLNDDSTISVTLPDETSIDYANRITVTVTDKDGNPLTIEEVISDSRNLAEDLETKTQWEQVAKIIENIKDEREREIIILRYGLNNKKPLTQREIAERLKISRSYVSRIEKKVLNDIKKKVK